MGISVRIGRAEGQHYGKFSFVHKFFFILSFVVCVDRGIGNCCVCPWCEMEQELRPEEDGRHRAAFHAGYCQCREVGSVLGVVAVPAGGKAGL